MPININKTSKHILAVLILSCTQFVHAANDGTEVGKLAETLNPGEWGELTTIGADAAFSASDSIFEYGDKMVFDPVQNQVLFFGSSDPGGAANAKFIKYEVATNTWTVLPDPPFVGGIKHSYKQTAIDIAGRRMYYRPMGSDSRYFSSINLDNLAAGWTQEADIDGISYVQDASALDFFAPRGTIVLHSGDVGGGKSGLTEFNPQTKTWSTMNGSFSPVGRLHAVLECNSVHGLCIFGGGDQTNNIWKLNSDGTTVDMGAGTPVNAFDTRFANTTVDSVTGDYLVLTSDDKFYSYDVVTGNQGTWSLIGQGAGIPPFNGYTSTESTFHMATTALNKYGVVFYVQYRNTGSKVWLYRHGAGLGNVVPNKPGKPAKPGVNKK